MRDFELQFSIIRGKLSYELRQRDGLSREAIGGLWEQEQTTIEIHGWIYLATANFAALWEQVTAGGYERCSIELMAEGADDNDEELWADNPLSITSANIIFTRGGGSYNLKGVVLKPEKARPKRSRPG